MSAKTNFIVDTIILVAFLVAFEPSLTGIAIHEWLSLAFAATLIIHVLLHWDWVIQVAVKFVRKLFHSSRLNFLVDSILFIAFTLVMLSGVLISRAILPTLGIQVNVSQSWRFLHAWSADISVFLLAVHFALHWKWVVNTFKRYLINPFRGQSTKPTLQSIPVRTDE
jgi:Domain of unknown function (DUF4405)